MTGQFSKDELVPPAWLDKAFFRRALRSYRRDATIEVTDVEITPGTAPGEHYASVMFKAKVTYSSREAQGLVLRTILKTVPQGDSYKAEFLSKSPAFRNEVRMYVEVLPEMERLLRVAGDSTTFAPPLVYQNLTSEPAPVMVFEDVSPEGFQTFNDGIENWDHVQLIVRRLAKFHALSIYLNKNGFPFADLRDHLWLEMIEDQDSKMAGWLKPNIGRLLAKMKDWEGFGEFHGKIDGQVDYQCSRITKEIRNPTAFSVLNHGDFHAKNMMYKNEGKTDEDLVFIDFQFPVWSTPALDLMNVFFMLCHDHLVEDHREDIILAYYQEFSETLKKVRYREEIPSLLDLNLAMLAAAPMDLIFCLVNVPQRLFDMREVDFDAMMENPDEFTRDLGEKVHSNPEYQEYVLRNLKRVQKTGVLEC